MTIFPIPSGFATSFEEAVRKLQKYILSSGIRSVLLGVSGGPDSVLALHLLAGVAKRLPGFRLSAAHANFQLRGEESIRDESFVKELARSLPEVEFFFKRFDTLRYASYNKVSIEMAARELRHSWWDEIRSRNNIQLIATGHNADDNEETLLLNLLRGSSPRGLRGMAPLGDRIFRPLLGLHREEILRLLKEVSISQESPVYITDSTNLSSDYRRNFLRNEILPQLRSRWEGLDYALQTSMELQAEASALNDFAVRGFLNDHDVAGLNELRYQDLRHFPAPLTLIYTWLAPHGISTAKAREITSHIPDHALTDHALTESATQGRRWILADGSQVVTTNLSLRLEPASAERYAPFTMEQPSPFSIREINEPSEEIMKEIRQAGLDEIYLPRPLTEYEWRRPQEGDKIYLFPDKTGRRKSKLLSDILREAGLPLTVRKSINLLVNKNSGEIIWIPGIRRAGADLIDENCTKIFHLNLRK